MTRLSRRAFLASTGGAITLTTVAHAWAIPAPPPAPPPPGPVPVPTLERLDARLSRNHGHVFSIGMDDVRAAVDRTYDLSGSSGHKHEVTLTRTHFLEIQQGKIVRLPSTSTGGHIHRVYARARPTVLPEEETSACEVFIGGKDDHELVIPKSHLEAAVSRTYDIQANSPHTHPLVLEASHFARLRKGEKVVVTTGRGAEDNHTHVCFITSGRPVGSAPK